MRLHWQINHNNELFISASTCNKYQTEKISLFKCWNGVTEMLIKPWGHIWFHTFVCVVLDCVSGVLLRTYSVNWIHPNWILDMFLCPPAAAHQEEARWKLLRHQQHRNPHVCGCHHQGGEAAVQRDSHTQVKNLHCALPPDQHGVSPVACLVSHRSWNGLVWFPFPVYLYSYYEACCDRWFPVLLFV